MPAHLVKQEGKVAIFDLLGSGDHERIESLLELYARLFPKYQHYVPRMKRRAEFGNEHRAGHIVHYWLIEVDGNPAGLRTFRYVRDRHCGLAHALAVDPAYREVIVREKRLALYIIYECLHQVIQDAKQRMDSPPLGIVNEVEPQRLMEHYICNGLVQLPVQYVEPIFPPEAKSRNREEELAITKFSPMNLGFLPNPQVKLEKYTREMISGFVSAFLVDHYGLPQDHPAVIEVLETIGI